LRCRLDAYGTPPEQQRARCAAGIGHGAEFDHGEGLAMQAGALLAEEDGGAEFDAHEQSQHR